MSILRSSKFFKYFNNLARSVAVTRPREVNSRLLIKNSPVSCISSRFLQASASPKHVGLEKHIQKLDLEVRRTGKVVKKELDDVLFELKKSKHASSTQALMLIRCCGNLLPQETLESRTQLLNDIWASLENLGVKLDISHYNALLRVHLENEFNFSPTEFLEDLEKKGIEPNRVTFQRLIAACCQKGDIEGATRILEFMKEKQMPINESVFSSLIHGHFQADDVESAVGILGVMKQANIKPSSETYTVLMYGYAKQGDIDSIKKVLAQCQQEEVDISDRDLLEVIYNLAVNKHTGLIDQLTGDLKKTPGYNQDAKNVILRLVVKGEDEAAVKILRTMQRLTDPEDGASMPVGNFLIKQMVMCNRDLDKIIALCDELKKSQENEQAYFVATEASLHSQNPSLSRQLLSLLSKEHENCQHYYWPLLCNYGKAKDFDGIQETLKQITEDVKQPVNGETLRDYVVPFFPEGEEGVMGIRKAGIPLSTAAAAMVGHLLNHNKLKQASEIALKFRANYHSLQLCRSAVGAYASTGDAESFSCLVRIILENEKDDKEVEEGSAKLLADRMLLDAVYQTTSSTRAEKMTALLEAYLNQGIGISPQTAEKLQNRLQGEQLTTQISNLLTKLTSPELALSDIQRPELSRRTFVGLQDEASILRSINAATAKGDSTKNLKRHLLSTYCINKNLEKAEQYYKELCEDNFDFVPGTLVHMMDLYVTHEKLPEALEVYNKLMTENPGLQIDISKVLKLGGLMAKLDKINELMELLSKHKVETDYAQKGFNTNALGWRLLNTLVEKQDPALLKTVFNSLVENRFIEPNNITLGPLIKVHIMRDDIDSALAEFEECCHKYRATPWKNEIACKLIQKEDPVSLQKLTDLSTDIHGEINSLYDLVLSFIECGRIRQARKILETPGLRTRNQRIASACERYNSEGKVNFIENLVEATRDLHHIDRADIYYHLLHSYCKADDVDKAFGLWAQMQDEDVQPTDAFLVELGSILKKHGRPVPFEIPSAHADKSKSPQPTAATPVKELRKVMNARNVDEALSCLSRINPQELTVGDRSKLLNLLLNNGRIGEASKILLAWLEKGLKPTKRVVNELINGLAKIGDVDTLNTLGNALDLELKKSASFSNRLSHCMVEAGRVDELLSDLSKKLKSAKTAEDINIVREEFPKGGIFSVLSSCPDAIPKVEELAKEYREKGINEPTNSLWTYYFSRSEFERAKEFWSLLKPKEEKIMFQQVLNQIRSNKDKELATELISVLKTAGHSSQQLAPAICALIDVENMSGNVVECERLMDELVKDCPMEHINRATLLRLKRAVEASGKPFKYSLPPKRWTQQRTDDTTSSDSDSDSEAPARRTERS